MVSIRHSLSRFAIAASGLAASGLAAGFAVGLALLPALASAEPKAPTQEESADVAFSKSFLGKTYDDELDIEGWNDLGGGLVVPPIYVHEYQREDGTYLVLTSREASAPNSTVASFVVVDALIVPKPQKDVEFSIACMQAPDETLKFMGEAKGSEQKEWWTDIRRAWEISLETGQIASVQPKGIRCTNASWGQ
jgi:hypothetical protein